MKGSTTNGSSPLPEHDAASEDSTTTSIRSAGGIPISFQLLPFPTGPVAQDLTAVSLHLEHARLGLLRGFDELLCLEGLTNVEQLPHQIDTVRKVLRHFQGRALLADEVGLGKTIEAGLLLREYLLRGLARRVLILVPATLVSQWHEELLSKFLLDFAVPRGSDGDRERFWAGTDRVLASMSYAKSRKRAELVASVPWDLVIVDEAHHCKNRATQNWQLVNSLKRRYLFLLTATPVQNNLLELYNLLTLLEPGHLKTESDFKKQYVRRGNPRDPLNRERLRSLLGEVMVRNTRSLVQMDLPPRYAQTMLAQPQGAELQLHEQLRDYVRSRAALADEAGTDHGDSEPTHPLTDRIQEPALGVDTASQSSCDLLSRKQIAVLLTACGSHPRAIAQSLENIVGDDPLARPLIDLAKSIPRCAKDEQLLQLMSHSAGDKMLVFANFRRTLEHLAELLEQVKIPFTMFTGDQSAAEKDAAVEDFREHVPVMLCSETGGEGRNLQFANTLINFDLPWNPMRIEQRVGRIHRIGQTREVFVFNLCTAGSLEAKILGVLGEKIRMFELVVGEIGSILGNLEGGEEFENLVLNLWLRARNERELNQSFDHLGESLLVAQEEYLQTKELDEALFGEDYE